MRRRNFLQGLAGLTGLAVLPVAARAATPVAPALPTPEPGQGPETTGVPAWVTLVTGQATSGRTRWVAREVAGLVRARPKTQVLWLDGENASGALIDMHGLPQITWLSTTDGKIGDACRWAGLWAAGRPGPKMIVLDGMAAGLTGRELHRVAFGLSEATGARVVAVAQTRRRAGDPPNVMACEWEAHRMSEKVIWIEGGHASILKDRYQSEGPATLRYPAWLEDEKA